MDFLDYLEIIAKKDQVIKLVVGAIIVNQNGNILLVKRKTADFMGGIYEIPGGNIEQDETILEAVAREVKEETNLVMSKVDLFIDWFDYLSGSGKKSRQLNFKISVESYSPIILTEHEEYKWVHYTDIKDINDITPELKHTLLILAFNMSQQSK